MLVKSAPVLYSTIFSMVVSLTLGNHTIGPVPLHYSDVIMTTMASQITSHAIVYFAVYSGVDQRKHQNSMSLLFVWGIHRSPVNSPHKGPVTRKMFPFDDVIMASVVTMKSTGEPGQNDNEHKGQIVCISLGVYCSFSLRCFLYIGYLMRILRSNALKQVPIFQAVYSIRHPADVKMSKKVKLY